MPLGVARAGGLDDLVPFLAQGPAEALQDLLLVVHQQDRAARDGCHARASTGRSIRISVPSPTRLATLMVPPSPSMMFLAIGSPRPVPARRVVKYGSKMCARSSVEMPTPR